MQIANIGDIFISCRDLRVAMHQRGSYSSSQNENLTFSGQTPRAQRDRINSQLSKAESIWLLKSRRITPDHCFFVFWTSFLDRGPKDGNDCTKWSSATFECV
jgi:hypothetical protein